MLMKLGCLNMDERLVDAAFNRDLALVKQLLEKGIDVNSRDSDNSTALEYAAMFGQTDMTRLLIEKGAEVNTINDDGETPLYCAVDDGHTEIEKILRDAGAVK